MNANAVAIAGFGAVSALGRGVTSIEKGISSNASGLSPRECLIGNATQKIVSGFVPSEINRALAAHFPAHPDSRAFHYAATALDEAVSNSAGLLASVPAARRAFVLSTTKANIEGLEMISAKRPCSESAQRHIQPALLAADLASHFHCAGPVQCVSAACISGLLALHQAAALIRRGQADIALVAGVDLISQFVLSGFNTLKSLDPEGARPFDKSRVGLSLGEGAGAIILARRSLLSGLAVLITGSGSSNDANHITGPSRDGSGLALAIRRALAVSAIAPDKIDFISAHGTGTVYNDNMESLALRSIYGENTPPFNSSKGMFGHTLGAAGVLETIVCLIAMRSRQLPGTPRLQERDPAAPISLLRESRTTPQLDTILKLNSGFGGTNAAVVLERSPA